MIPLFDKVCSSEDIDFTQEAIPPDFGCPTTGPGGGGPGGGGPGGGGPPGGGATAWYHFPSFAYLRLCKPGTSGCGDLHGAYLHGMNTDECEIGGNGATACIIGEFVDVMSTGTVGSGVGGGSGSKTLGVQLIK